jgi:pyruvate/2-oxoglutarate dehydrogenase complex dihydrolipoamide acyltransferase (E2) component
MPRVPILMPQLGESIAEATIVSLDIAVGDTVTADDEIMEVETQKASMEITTSFSGTVAEISVAVGESYPVGATLGYLEVSDEEARRVGFESAPPTPAKPQGDTRRPQQDAPPPSRVPKVAPTVSSLPVPANARGATYLSPRMRARMDELDINASDLAGIPGSGAAGRVTVEDFEDFMAKIEQKKMTPASPMRIAVADSMRRSWSRPLATVGAPVQLDRLLAHRKTAIPKPGPALYIVRALALALAENTAIAGRLIGKRIVHPDSIDIGFAVEVADGVLVPVIRDVDQKPLSTLVSAYDDLVKLARARKLPKEAAEPGIATVTNFGTFGIAWATPIPLPEQNLVLGLGAGRKKPLWDEATGSWIPVTEAEITLSFDHRILDGGAAGRLLARIAELLQAPDAL